MAIQTRVTYFFIYTKKCVPIIAVGRLLRCVYTGEQIGKKEAYTSYKHNLLAISKSSAYVNLIDFCINMFIGDFSVIRYFFHIKYNVEYSLDSKKNMVQVKATNKTVSKEKHEC